MANYLMIAQIVVCIVLILSIMFQDSKGKPISNSGESQAYFKPKGKDAFLNKVTTISAVFLFGISIGMLFVK